MLRQQQGGSHSTVSLDGAGAAAVDGGSVSTTQQQQQATEGDALDAFQSQQQQQQTAAAGSPTIKSLAAWQLMAEQQADALDGLQGDGHRAATAPGSSGGGSGEGAALVRIPLLPSGSTLTLHIKSTWGDEHYVGLAGIELFDAQGRLVQIRRAGGLVRGQGGGTICAQLPHSLPTSCAPGTQAPR